MAQYRDMVQLEASLRECPFCGGVAELNEWSGRISCLDCGAIMEVGIGPAGEIDTIPKLITAWNHRDRESAAATLMGVKELARVKKNGINNI